MTAARYLDQLNREYLALHKAYEELFWTSYMGDRSVDARKDQAQAARDAFRASPERLAQVKALMRGADAKTKARLAAWKRFFELYQAPPELLELKRRINALESAALHKRASRKEGYADPETGAFVEASFLRMRTMRSTHDDERVRKACHEACEDLATGLLPEYLELVRLRNEYARALGYEDFYAFKVEREDGMTKRELFALFDAIYARTKASFAEIRALEKRKPGLRQPWNFTYFMAGDFTKEEDPYFQFEDALIRWGRSFSALGVGFRGGRLTLDLLDRKGKWNNGFCHWPDLVRYEGGKRVPGSSNFTCNVVAGQVGSGVQGYTTLFHEGGHAAHFLNAEMRDAMLNAEYPPMSMAWAETQSMFLDTLFSSVEWRVRYARDREGAPYPFELHERKARALAPLRVMGIHGLMFVSEFERRVYEMRQPTAERVMALARRMYRKYYDQRTDSLHALNIPHLYSWESSGSYHGYALAEIALHQWRAHFLKKYGYIVDNPKVGKEMAAVWKLGASLTYKQFVRKATGKNPSAAALLAELTNPIDRAIRDAKRRIERLEKVPAYRKPVKLDASVRMVHGNDVIADDTHGFERMAERYAAWVRAQGSSRA